MKKEITKKEENTVDVDFILSEDGRIDPTTIEDETVRAFVENLIKNAAEREERLKEELEETRLELEESKARRMRKTPPTVEWSAYLSDTLDYISAKNQVPITPRQRSIIDKGIRMIARELTGVYRLNWSNSGELVTLKAAADKMAEIIIGFGIPEETDPAFLKVSKEKTKKGDN